MNQRTTNGFIIAFVEYGSRIFDVIIKPCRGRLSIRGLLNPCLTSDHA